MHSFKHEFSTFSFAFSLKKMSYQLEKPIPTGIEVMEDLNYVDDELPVNEIIMEYMITRKKYRIKETLQKFRGI